MKKRHRVVGMGGTFDHFHKGHEHFIRQAYAWADMLLIGVTDQRMTRSKLYPDTIQTFRERARQVQQFCKDEHIKAEIVQLHDAYGPTLEKSGIDALCGTQETLDGLDKINETRMAMGLKSLPIYIAEMLLDETNQVLHADRIRAGEVDRNGRVFLAELAQGLKLNETQRQYFKKPLGKLVSEPSENYREMPVVVVGDTSLQRWLENDWEFTMGVYDLQEQRQPTTSQMMIDLHPDLIVSNPAGNITSELVKTAQKWSEYRLIKIDGEEDLVTLVMVLALPLESCIYYGQPHQGLVEIHVTEAKKAEVFRILTTG